MQITSTRPTQLKQTSISLIRLKICHCYRSLRRFPIQRFLHHLNVLLVDGGWRCSSHSLSHPHSKCRNCQKNTVGEFYDIWTQICIWKFNFRESMRGRNTYPNPSESEDNLRGFLSGLDCCVRGWTATEMKIVIHLFSSLYVSKIVTNIIIVIFLQIGEIKTFIED